MTTGRSEACPPTTTSAKPPKKKTKHKRFKRLMQDIVAKPPPKSDITSDTSEELRKRGLGHGRFSKLDKI
jgi:hypothetical protein